MAISRVERTALVLLVACAAGAAAQEEAPAPRACSISFDSTSLDAQTSRGVFRGIRLMCEDVSIEADEATASEVVPQEGEWQLRGSIRIEAQSAVMTADTATFRFADNALVSGELEGSPVVLEDFIEEENSTVRASASRIVYDNSARVATIVMGDEASLIGPNFEMRGCGEISYNLDNGEVDSVSNCGEPFEIKFLPRDEPAAEETPTAQ